MTTKREVNYWKRRFIFEKKQQLQNTAEYETAMRARLKEVEQVLEQEVDYWLKRYAANQEITVKDARKILSTIGTRDWHMTLTEFKAKAKAGGFDKELDAEYFRSQLSRLENIDEQLTNLLSQYATAETDKLESSLTNQFQQTYMHSIYLTQMERAKLSSGFANVNEYQVKAIVHKPWRGSDFSKRIWKSYTETLPNELGDALLRGSVLGHSHEQIFKMMRQRLKDVEDYQLHRLVITEMGHVAETATAEAYKEEGVEQYQYLATLESHTCDECAHLDEKVFDLKDKVEGLNYPLIHPYCRCTTMPYIEGLPDSSERWARDPETGKGMYVDNMTYRQWAEKYNGNNDYTAELLRPKPFKELDLNKASETEMRKYITQKFGMNIQETSRTKLSKTALKETIKTVGQFSELYNALPDKIPRLTAYPPSKMGNTIAWYSSYVKNKVPYEFGLNIKWFKNDEDLKDSVNRMVKSHWLSNNADANHIMLHEFSHHIDRQLSKLGGTNFSTTVFNKMESDSKTIDIAKISDYANSSYDSTNDVGEPFAEIMAEAYGPTPGTQAKEFKKYFEKMALEVIENARKTKGL